MKEKAKLGPVRVQFKLEQAEYVRAVRFYLRKSHMVGWVQLVLLAVVLSAVAVLTWMMGRLTFLNNFLLTLAATLVVYSVYLYFVHPGRLFRKDPKLAQEAVFLFSEEDIARQDDEAAALYDWAVKKLWRSKEFYFLFLKQGGYLLLPRRGFWREEDQDIFEKLVKKAEPEAVFRVYG